MSKVKMTIKNTTVIYAREDDERSSVSVTISEDQHRAILDKIVSEFGEDAAKDASWTPCKDSDSNGLYVKTMTRYPVDFYEGGCESDTISSVNELGTGAVVDIAITIGESHFRRESGFTAYLSAVNIRKFGDVKKRNPFDEE